MRRIRRLLATFYSALSLLLFVAVCVLWVRSSVVCDGVETWRIRREPDGSATAVWFQVSSSQRLWLQMSFARLGREGAGDMWDSYYQRADRSGGRWGVSSFHASPVSTDIRFGGPGFQAATWGPFRWRSSTQIRPDVPFAERNVNLGVWHWFAA
jgi:hypothetical protein